jgi:phosphoglycerol geranylgeranyltransferase
MGLELISMPQWVENYLMKRIREKGTLHFTLIDPDETDDEAAIEISECAEKAGSSGVLVGGSTVASVQDLDSIVKRIKDSINIPVILFPNGITGISRYADAIFFSSLLNSNNPYYITGAQALGAPLVRKFGLESISLGYIIVGDGGAAGFVGQANPIPYNKPELASIYALAAQYIGMRFVYLEAGSGASLPVPEDMIVKVKKLVNIPIIVGGGIKSTKEAKIAVKAGADIIVTGSIVENVSLDNLKKIISSINELKLKR